MSESGAMPEGVCRNDRGRVVCCPNYTLQKESCVPCPPGRYGKYCEEFCPPGFFGNRCREECDCDELKCNPEYGCKAEANTLSSKTTTIWTSQTEVPSDTVLQTDLSDPSLPVTISSITTRDRTTSESAISTAPPLPWQWIIPVSTGLFLLCFVIICLVCKNRLKVCQRRKWSVLNRRSLRVCRNINMRQETVTLAEVGTDQEENNRSTEEETRRDNSCEFYLVPMSSAESRPPSSGDPDPGYSSIVDVQVHQLVAADEDNGYLQVINKEYMAE